MRLRSGVQTGFCSPVSPLVSFNRGYAGDKATMDMEAPRFGYLAKIIDAFIAYLKAWTWIDNMYTC